MIKRLFPLVFLFLYGTGRGQEFFMVNGKVQDSASGEPLALASVFCQNTTQGTLTDKEGFFNLTLNKGGYDLIITYTGYHSQRLRISPELNTRNLVINLVKDEKSIEEVVIHNSNEVKDGWEKYGRFFLDYFIGSTPFAKQCTLLNPEVLTFYFFRKANKLKVTASEPLLISNKALGYHIRYHLDSFLYRYQTDICNYIGYAFYETMNGSDDSLQYWEKNRQKAYYGSRLHFMHSCFDSTLYENGFVLAMLNENDSTHFTKIDHPYDSTFYQAIDSTDEKDLFYPRRLRITYTKSIPENEYLIQYHLPLNIGVQVSYVDMLDVISVKRNGYYYDQKDWINYGYWSWKNIADQVPYDYTPD
jgi:hypothetical protein